MSSTETRRIQVTEKLWERIAESVPRNWKGELYSWALRERMDKKINEALDRAERKAFKSGAV